MKDFQISASNLILEKINGLKFGLISAEKLNIKNDDTLYQKEFDNLKLFIENKFAEMAPAEDEVVSHVRRMYRRIGWEPTRYRPSSEALIRRILKGLDLYRINNLVDFGNLASARYHIPMGLYDTDKIESTITMDVGKEEETYQGFSKPEIHAEGKLILRDSKGIFGNPTADSLRTGITENTKSALAIFFCPPEVENNYLQQTLNYLAEFYRSFSDENRTETEILVLD